MKGDDHAVLSLATVLLCLAPFVTADITPECLWCCVCLLAGVFGGSHLPDADAVAAQGLHLKTCAGFLISCISIGTVSVVRVVYRVAGCRFDGRHRQSLHTLWGVSVGVGAIAVLTTVIFADGGWWSNSLLFVYAGLLWGSVLHLAEDCCTISGLQPFKPFSSLHLKGGINTGDYRDRRPVWFTKYLICLAAAVISGQYVYSIPSGSLLIPVLGVTVISWFVFHSVSQRQHARRR